MLKPSCLLFLLLSSMAASGSDISQDFGMIRLKQGSTMLRTSLLSMDHVPLDGNWTELESRLVRGVHEVLWFRYELSNPTPQSIESIFQASMLVDDMSVFVCRQNACAFLASWGYTQESQNVHSDQVVARVKLSLQPGETTIVTRVITTTQYGIDNPKLMGADFAVGIKQESDIIAGLVYGCLVALVLYNLLYLIRFFDSVQLVYVLFLVTTIANFEIISGVISNFFGSTWLYEIGGALNLISINLAASFALIFNVIAVDAKRKDRFFYYLSFPLTGLFYGIIIFTLINGTKNFLFWQWSLTYLGGFIYDLFAVLILIRACKRGYRPAYFYLLALSFALLGIASQILTINGVFPDNIITTTSLYTGVCFEMIFISLGVADKHNLEQQEHLNKVTKLNQNLEESNHELVLAQKDLKAKNAEIIEKERARTLFFHNTSHELRTPINGIISYIDLVRNGHYGQLQAKAYTQLTKAYRLVEGLKFQVNLILDLAKAKRGELKVNYQNLSLSSLLREVDNLGEALKLQSNGYTYTSKLVSDDDRFIGDRLHLMTLIRNLMGNAFKFKAADRDNHVEIYIEKTSEVLVISIKDTGIGIEESNQEKIFEEFTQIQADASRSYEGTGLGLSMVKDLLAILGGEISLESRPGKGSCFTLKIPSQLEADSLVSNEEDLPTFNQDYGPKIKIIEKEVREFSIAKFDASWKVMIIDDNVNNCEVFEEILKQDGYSLDHALSGKEGIEKMRQDPPHLLLLDMMMPEMSGEDVVGLMKTDPLLRLIPIILVTARASEEDRIYGLSLGVDDYLPKPIVANELRLKVRNHIERQKINQEMIEEIKLRKSLETKVEATTNQLIQAEKMVLLGQLVAGVAHDMAAPAQLIGNANHQAKKALEEISSRLFSLIGDSEDPESMQVRDLFNASFVEIQESFAEIDLGGKRMNDIQMAIRKQSRLDATEDEFNLLELIKESMIILNSKLKPWTVETSVDSNLVVKARRSQIGQVIANLLSNAADALSEQSTNPSQKPDILIETSIIEDSKISHLLISVEDSGAGVSEKDIESIFEAFFTTKAVGYGTGLGLSICSKIIHAHNGTIIVEHSKRLGGARFVIELPYIAMDS